MNQAVMMMNVSTPNMPHEPIAVRIMRSPSVHSFRLMADVQWNRTIIPMHTRRSSSILLSRRFLRVAVSITQSVVVCLRGSDRFRYRYRAQIPSGRATPARVYSIQKNSLFPPIMGWRPISSAGKP